MNADQTLKRFLETLPKGRLKVVRQPAYSPALNASEQVWNYLKNVSLRNRVFKNIEALKKELSKALEKFEQQSKLITQFFKHPEVAFY
nr:transposase [Microscilla marina]